MIKDLPRTEVIMAKSNRKKAVASQPLAEEVLPATPEPDDELLVSYLDGELSTEEALAVEERLGSEPRLRERMTELEQAWNLLDELETSTIDKAIIQSTMEMVAVKAEEELEEKVHRRRQRRMAGQLVVAMAVVALFLAGYGLVRLMVPSRTEQILRDMPIIEKLDEYSQVEEIEFLRELDRQGVFDDEPQKAAENHSGT
jgi:hypothetical protein